ncbi:hypothetical protein [Streptomyces sp. NPDC046870]|uniref:hypothetical protein n=1 Tax=Streptomyces sp. NPDC046870 TaxID=3155135 RepID=UPI003454F805
MRGPAREPARALRRLVVAGQWRPAPADTEAAAVLDRLTAPPPVRRAAAARAMDRERRLRRVLRTVLHHLDADAVSPSAAALPAAVARAPPPWHGVPNPPVAAAPRYGPEWRAHRPRRVRPSTPV